MIRTACLDDVEPTLALWEVAAGPTRLPPTTETMTRLIETNADALLVVEEEGEIVGTLIVGWDGWRCHLYRLAVREDFRHRGIATALVAHARERAIGLGARRLDAMVDDDNELGQAFWTASGFLRGAQEDRRWTFPLRG